MTDFLISPQAEHDAENSPLIATEIAELDRRLAEDDATPGDTYTWESIKSEAQARWQR